MKDINEIPSKKPIICPECGSREIAIITEYHKCIWLKILLNLIVAMMFISFAIELKKLIAGEFEYIIIVVLMLFYLMISIIVYVTESKTHAKAICRDCGKIWLID